MIIRKLGMTGTRAGMNARQRANLVALLILLDPPGPHALEFHHGLCVGADEQAHKLAKYFHLRIVGHPPTDTSKMMVFKKDEFDLIFSTLPYLTRNRVIVDATDALVAIPLTMVEEKRSGTWSTVRYARKQNKPICIIEVDGRMSYQHWPKELQL